MKNDQRGEPKMAGMDLSAMSLDELKTLKKDIEKAITTFEERKRLEAIAAVEAKVKEMGFTLAELTGGKSNGKAGAPVSVPKYVHPENPTVTWTGRGRQPRWIKEALQAGKSLDDFLIVKS
jgi:DNA-binding protein H-NS